MNELQNNNSKQDNHSLRKSIKAIALHLSTSKRASTKTENAILNREQEEAILIDFLGKDAFYTENIKLETYITEGAEQKIYFNEQKNTVFKVNSGIFYASWADYFMSLLLHNFFFEDTSYTFLGMKKENNALFMIVEQPFIPTQSGLLGVETNKKSKKIIEKNYTHN
ncbi:MAG: hypothetical protein EAZ85_06600 [Bacteroidetes bacterium]|nr:MAG: hypothetical protein EAZ85_06600 [Bacteroidota bacterium]TAG87569.1 MAG: hypothetical protein EAZ20_10390 [Bacteroidota bacterium]